MSDWSGSRLPPLTHTGGSWSIVGYFSDPEETTSVAAQHLWDASDSVRSCWAFLPLHGRTPHAVTELQPAHRGHSWHVFISAVPPCNTTGKLFIGASFKGGENKFHQSDFAFVRDSFVSFVSAHCFLISVIKEEKVPRCCMLDLITPSGLKQSFQSLQPHRRRFLVLFWTARFGGRIQTVSSSHTDSLSEGETHLWTLVSAEGDLFVFSLVCWGVYGQISVLQNRQPGCEVSLGYKSSKTRKQTLWDQSSSVIMSLSAAARTITDYTLHQALSLFRNKSAVQSLVPITAPQTNKAVNNNIECPDRGHSA